MLILAFQPASFNTSIPRRWLGLNPFSGYTSVCIRERVVPESIRPYVFFDNRMQSSSSPYILLQV